MAVVNSERNDARRVSTGEVAPSCKFSIPSLRATLFEMIESESGTVGHTSNFLCKDTRCSIDFSGLSQAEAEALFPEHTGIRSSGTTGPGRIHWRTREQVMLEARAIVDAFKLDSVGDIISCAPLTHAFGFLCGLAVAALLRVRLSYVPQLEAGIAIRRSSCRHVMVLALPSTWHIISRLRNISHRHITIVHSAGPIPHFARQHIGQLIGVARICEIFGSSETGAIGYRLSAQSETEPWRVFPDVNLISSPPTHVTGPRCAAGCRVEDAKGFEKNALIELADEFAWCGPMRVRITGRKGDRIKVNGVNVRLGDVANALAALLPDYPIAVIQERDPIRGDAFSIAIQASSISGPDRSDRERAISSEIQRLFGPHVYPRGFTYPASLRATRAGKIPIYESAI